MIAFATYAFTGCGTVQEGTYEDNEFADTTPISKTAMLEYRIDSLARENQKLQQQVEHSTVENRNLSGRITELETKGGGGTSTPVSISTPTPTRTISNPAYESALAKFRGRDFQGSIDEFSSLLSSGVADDMADNCAYWIGESFFAQRKFPDAIQNFESVVALAGSDKADDAQLMIGNAYAAMGDRTAAREALQGLISKFPSSPLVKRARAKMSKL